MIYGANTDVGKTVVSAALCRHAAALGRHVTYIKPVQTGLDTDAAAVLRHAQPEALDTETGAALQGWHLVGTTPARSPDEPTMIHPMGLPL